MAHSPIGFVHLFSALLAMLTGAVVLLTPKGSAFHKRTGYVYVVSMLVLNATAFMIYQLFGKFGPFHGLALVSLVSLIGGMVPVLLRQRVKSWLHWHYYFMNWSVVGLYAAFWSETLSRTLPMGKFWPVVMGATAMTATIGSWLIRRNAARLLSVRQPTVQIQRSAVPA
jgi:uncharacterized membrane protein